MPTTLSKGYKLPLTGERDWYDSLESNISLSNSHQHNGTDGVKIDPKDLNKATANISSGSWSSVAGQSGTYKQTITVPSGYTVALMHAKFYVTSTGHEVHPTIKKVTSTTYDVYTNDNSVGYTVVYA